MKPLIGVGTPDSFPRRTTAPRPSPGLIGTSWEQGPGDGLGAMVGAWSCSDEATKLRCTLMETDLMQGIAAYNQVDCKVMMEIVRYLRANH